MNDIELMCEYDYGRPHFALSDFMSDWRSETSGSPHADTKSIHLRTVPLLTLEDVFESDEVVTTHYAREHGWQTILLDIMYDVQGSSLGRAMLVMLKPGGYIPQHIDEGGYCARHDRYHYPLITNTDCMNKFGDTRINMLPQHLYKVNNKALHSARNDGDSSRVHLIVDVKPF